MLARVATATATAMYRLFTFTTRRTRATTTSTRLIDFGEDGEDAVADVGNNADLYAANQKSTELINDAHMEEAPLRFMGQDVSYHRPLSLD